MPPTMLRLFTLAVIAAAALVLAHAAPHANVVQLDKDDRRTVEEQPSFGVWKQQHGKVGTAVVSLARAQSVHSCHRLSTRRMRCDPLVRPCTLNQGLRLRP